ncbi:MAG: Crp/Fnr family transcriptional regulator [Chitinophagales bacterium]|nr:Crp/Fnr family transcriptional regulator [Chitinophagales bacterium]HAE35137.1 Crp/Fnr family transcriptional regulator [Bacteroidota bacterium]MCB9021026.1 Crp/Fnr family transcriptional regulator [Chitinophagales bacterium]HPE97296.1 Crp/Fnr family transcriptional regulator [Chitinophagales bacterium]HPR28019.1 Crp/Fnr family transcriptional regulator [Chitinophagales bacterium]
MTGFEQLDAHIARFINLDDAQRQYIHGLLEQREVRKKDHLFRAGQICRYEYYVVRGCLRVYFLDDHGSEVNLMFPVEDWWLGDLISFTEQTPSALYVEALEDSQLLMINKENKESLYEKIPAFERMFRVLILRNLAVLQHRLIATISHSAEERYLAFIERYPDIPQRIPQHHIASYLGVSPEFLSKIRKKLSAQ